MEMSGCEMSEFVNALVGQECVDIECDGEGSRRIG